MFKINLRSSMIHYTTGTGMVKPKWILELFPKGFYSGLHMTLEIVGTPNFGPLTGASQCLYPEGQSQQRCWRAQSLSCR